VRPARHQMPLHCQTHQMAPDVIDIHGPSLGYCAPWGLLAGWGLALCCHCLAARTSAAGVLGWGTWLGELM
jgi:hypothetical protein